VRCGDADWRNGRECGQVGRRAIPPGVCAGAPGAALDGWSDAGVADIARLKAALRAHRPDPGLPIEGIREKMAADAAVAPLPEGIRVTPVRAGGVPAELVEPEAGAGRRTVLYLHGGGYCAGSARAVRGLTGRLALRAGARVLALDYRLAPDHPYPAALQDALAAYRWLLSDGPGGNGGGPGGGADPADVVIGGDSAGGGLTVSMLVALREAGDPLPSAAFAISPWADLRLASETIERNAADDPIISVPLLARFAAWYTGSGTDPADPAVSPALADLSGLPRLLVQVGDDECVLGDASLLAERARACGVDVSLEVWSGVVHVWHLLAPRFDPANQGIERIAAWLAEAPART
jgi:epsilon-lactone hydrolase